MKLITEEQYDGGVSIVKLDYSKFDYDYIFSNNYDNKSLEDIVDFKIISEQKRIVTIK